MHPNRDIQDSGTPLGKTLVSAVVRSGRKARRKREEKKRLIHACLCCSLVPCPLQRSGAAGTFLRGPMGSKAYRSSGREKCPQSSFSLRGSLSQYSEKHAALCYLCFRSSGRTCFQSIFIVLQLRISSTIKHETSLFGNIVFHVLSGCCGSSLNYRPLSLSFTQQIFQQKMCRESFLSGNPI